jgi:hypothetical protein
MSLESTNTVDAVGIENDTGMAVLTLADSWDWSDEHAHLLALQSKLNSYFDFIASGQFVDVYPPAQDRSVAIDVVSRYCVPPAGLDFLDKASAVASEIGVHLRHKHFVGSGG